MRRRHGYYWTRFLVLTALLAATVVTFVAVGPPSWWQLVTAAVLAAVLGAGDVPGA